MTSFPGVTACCLALLLLPGAAQAGPDDELAGDPDAPTLISAEDEEDFYSPVDDDAGPSEAAPPRTAMAPTPPQGEWQPATPAGQWGDTQQYGRVWMPYSDAYTYAPPSGYGEPYQYLYYPSYGWTWVVAPWVWGWGPWPTFGVYGPARFGWYGHGWWRTPHRWHYAPSYRTGGFHQGVRPGLIRGGPGGRVAGPPGFRSPGHGPRGFAVRGGGSPGAGGWGHAGGGRPPSVRASGGHGGGGHRR